MIFVWIFVALSFGHSEEPNRSLGFRVPVPVRACHIEHSANPTPGGVGESLCYRFRDRHADAEMGLQLSAAVPNPKG